MRRKTTAKPKSITSEDESRSSSVKPRRGEKSMPITGRMGSLRLSQPFAGTRTTVPDARRAMGRADAMHRRTVNEIIRGMTRLSDPHDHDDDHHSPGAVDGPNLVTHLPDIVVHSDHRRQLPYRITKQAVVLFLDISGFTALCEKYSQAAKTGTEQLTKTLNGYMSALVSEIISYDGDILKFAGDAILSMWPVDSLRSMEAGVENVIHCALQIQHKHGTYIADGVTLKVKIGIAAGEVQILIIGNDEERTYVEVGRGIEDVNKAENMCEKGGDIMVSPGAWVHCSELLSEQDYIAQHDGKHAKVLHMMHSGAHYATERTTVVTGDMQNLELSIRNLVVPSYMILENISSTRMTETNTIHHSDHHSDSHHSHPHSHSVDIGAAAEQHADEKHPDHLVVGNMRRLRKTVITHFSRGKINNLKLFIAEPVIRKIEDGQPLEYLSEMRQVTMLFINLDVERSTKDGYLLLMQKCHQIIHANTKRMRGCISKIFAFDKGCTFMVVFGLPGFKHENDSAHALMCAHGIYSDLNRVSELKQTSIGVTTGPTYCGIVGHNHRHEYTVIGRRVNMGARLMMYYRGKVICDNTTFYYSKLNENYFIVQEAKELKGLQQVGTVREFRPQISLADEMEQIRVQEELKPIIGRDAELATFETCLEHMLATDAALHADRSPVVMIHGEVGMGRTRLLNAFLAAALRKRIYVVLCTLAVGNVANPYYTVRLLMNQLLRLDTVTSKEKRTKKIREAFGDNSAVLKRIETLEAILESRTTSDAPGQENVPPLDKVKEIIQLIVTHFAGRHRGILFAVDDAHLMDDHSWKCVRLFGDHDRSMLVLTQRTLPDKDITNETAAALMRDMNNDIITCMSMSNLYLASLACQLLNVARIPQSLDHILKLNSMGIPAWVDLLLREYLYEGVISIQPTLIYNHNETMISAAPRDLIIRRINRTHDDSNADEPSTTAARSVTNFVEELMAESVSPHAEDVCFYMLSQQIDDLKVPTSIASMIQARIDHMKELDQTVLKSASIIGQFFFREILQHILQTEATRGDIGESIQRLADAGVLACAAKKSLYRQTAGRRSLEFSGQTCNCRGSNEERPMSECRAVVFMSSSLRVTAYEIMLEQNRRPLHMAAANFLEEKIRRLSAGTRVMNESTLYESYIEEVDEEDDDNGDDNEEENRDVDQSVDDAGDEDEQRQEGGEDEVPELKSERGSFPTSSKTQMRRISPIASPTMRRLKTIIGPETSEPGGPSSNKAAAVLRKGRDDGGYGQPQSGVATNPADLTESVVVNYTGWDRLRVLVIQYPQIAEQYRGAGNTQNTTFYLTEAAAACLALFDHGSALTHLREVNRIFRDLKRNRNPFEGRVANLDNWKPDSFDEGMLEKLIGQTLFDMGKKRRAIPHFRTALKLFNCPQAQSGMQMKLAIAMELSLNVKRHNPPNNREIRLLSSQAHCLFYIFKDCIARGDFLAARYAVVQQLHKTERARDLLGQIEANTCMLKLSHLCNDAAMVREYETKAKVKCVVAMQNVRNDQIIRLADMYWTAFDVHLSRSGLSEAVESGLAASRLMMVVRGTKMQLHMLAALVKALIYADRTKDAVDVLDVMQSDAGSGDSRCWYFCGCLHMVLYMGIRVALVEDCISYSEEVLSQRLFAKKPQLLFTLACALCVYYKRVRQEDLFEDWRRIAIKYEPTRYETFLSAIGYLQLLECKLLQLSKLIGEIRRAPATGRRTRRMSTIASLNQADKRFLERVIVRDLAFADQLARRFIVIEPRVLILQAYHAAIRDRSAQARELLRQCAQRADTMSNVTFSRWAHHNHEVWYGVKLGMEPSAPTEADDAVAALPEPAEPPTSRSHRRESRRASLPRSELMGGQSQDPFHRWSRNTSLALHASRLSQTSSDIADLAGTAADKHDQWLKSAASAFPHWYIINHVRAETRQLLYFSLPLPRWFTTHWF